MKLPNPSYMMTVGKLRYIQSVYEALEYRNPDDLVGNFLPPLQRVFCMLQAKLQLSKLQLHPFYYYLIARTKYYDQIYIDAINSEIKHIFNIGCGSDTRAYRFADALRRSKISVIECDQPKSIFVKQTIAQRKWRTDHVSYASIDLNDIMWPDLERRLAEITSHVLVLLEGVSPYINEDSFNCFLKFIAAKVRAGSRISYDYKVRGVADDFGRFGRNEKPFRLSSMYGDVASYHEEIGYKLQHMELSSELPSRLLPNLPEPVGGFFAEDGLLELIVAQI
jgi:methyltransferase (TIGR00027 family)